jgi:DNA-binding response OmpR family regulator
VKILIMSAEPRTAEEVAAAVRFHWHDASVLTARDGEEGLGLFHAHQPDLVVLDLATPGTAGFAVLEALRRVSDAPVLALGAHDAEADQVRALGLGADDYIAKPFGHLVLLARMQALLRRAEPTPERTLPGLAAGPLRIDFGARQVWVQGSAVRLGTREYTLLYHLVRNAGRVLPSEVLAERVWGRTWGAGPADVKALVHRLRAKLDGPDGAGRGVIENARGRGYRFVPPAPPTVGAEGAGGSRLARAGRLGIPHRQGRGRGQSV